MSTTSYYTINAKFAYANNMVKKEENQTYVWNPETSCDELVWEEETYVLVDGVRFNQWFRWLNETGIEMEEVFIFTSNEANLFEDKDFVEENRG